MKLFQVLLTEDDDKKLNKLVHSGKFATRSDAVRSMIRDFRGDFDVKNQ